MQDWKTIKLNELITTITDYHANGAYKKLKENVTLLDNINFAAMIRSTNFEKNDFNDLKYIDEHAYEFLGKSKVFPGDVLMNKIANPGTVYYMPDLKLPVSLGMNLLLLRFNKETSPYFIYQYLKAKEQYVKSFTAGSVTKTITKQAVRNLDIILPPLPEQCAIASILSALDDKIELNLQMNKTLEEMAMALYKHWFVDFGPFQNGKFVDSELGMIPEGWEVKRLEEILKFKKGKKPKKVSPEYQEGFLPQILISSFDENLSGFAATQNMVITNQLDILMVMDGSGSGRTEIGFAGIVGSTISRIDIKEQFEKLRFITYLLLRSNQQLIKENTTGTSIPHTDKSFIFNFIIPVPDKKVIDSFNLQAKKFIELIKSNLNENRNLKKTRDTLLPKLISGEVRLKDVEKLVHESL